MIQGFEASRILIVIIRFSCRKHRTGQYGGKLLIRDSFSARQPLGIWSGKRQPNHACVRNRVVLLSYMNRAFIKVEYGKPHPLRSPSV